MKYMVMVNNKYMTQVEVDGSACAAEHVILDDIRYGMTSALAFDAAAMKTEHFNACFQSCTLVSIEELRRKSTFVQAEVENAIAAAELERNKVISQIDSLKAKQRELEYEINRLKSHTGREL